MAGNSVNHTALLLKYDANKLHFHQKMVARGLQTTLKLTATTGTIKASFLTLSLSKQSTVIFWLKSLD
jgi:hypothetical protein